MATTITEGNPPTRLTFTFPDGWQACQFDSSDFYRKKVERIDGMKAVDILASKGDRLVIMEVKDFRGHGPQNRHRQKSGALLAEIARKFACTVSALLAAKRSENKEFSHYATLLESSDKVQMILFLERDESPGFLRKNRLTLADLKSKLKRLMIAYNVRCQVYDRAHLPKKVEWRVE